MEAIIAIIAIIAVANVLRHRNMAHGNRDSSFDNHNAGPSQRERELEAELTDLRERVKVLERIATDDRETKRLSAEIENLRDH